MCADGFECIADVFRSCVFRSCELLCFGLSVVGCISLDGNSSLVRIVLFLLLARMMGGSL